MVYEDEEPDIHDPNYDESYQVRPLGGLSFNTSDYLQAGLFYICKSFAFKCWHPAVRGFLFVFFSLPAVSALDGTLYLFMSTF